MLPHFELTVPWSLPLQHHPRVSPLPIPTTPMAPTTKHNPPISNRLHQTTITRPRNSPSLSLPHPKSATLSPYQVKSPEGGDAVKKSIQSWKPKSRSGNPPTRAKTTIQPKPQAVPSAGAPAKGASPPQAPTPRPWASAKPTAPPRL